MTISYEDRVFTHAANRTKTHPQYLGWVLARYEEAEGISERDLANLLGVSSHDFLRLGLCLRPRADHFAEDVKQISAKFNVDVAVLAKVVRLVESVEVLATTDTGAISPEAGLLMAARAQRKKRTRQGKGGHDDNPPKP